MIFFSKLFKTKNSNQIVNCCICGEKINSEERRWITKDGYMCEKCQKPFGNLDSPKGFATYTTEQIKELKEQFVKPNTKKYSSCSEKRTEQLEMKHALNSHITIEDVKPFMNNPFSLSGKMMFDCGIPYFSPSESDKKIIQTDINYLVNKVVDTGILSAYKTGNTIKYLQIRTDIYTATKKIKKYPISVYINDGVTFYILSYTQSGHIGKAELTYCPDNKKGYTISYKTYSGCLEVRRICSYPMDGGSTTELYRRE